MQKQLCFGLSIALFCVVAVLYFNTNSGNNFELRTVSETEAHSVNGRGETGYDYQWLNGVNGNPGVTGGSATINAYNKSSDSVEIFTTTKIPVEIKESLEQHNSDLEPISLFWVTERSTDMELKTFFEKTKMKHNCGFFEPESNVFMWQNGRGYCSRAARTSVKTTNGVLPFAYEKDITLDMYSDYKAFDGQLFYAGARLDDAPGVISIYPITSDVFFLYHPYTFCAGYKYLNFNNEIEISPISYILYLNQNGNLKNVERKTLEGQEAIEIELISEGYNVVDQYPVKRIMTFLLLSNYNYVVKQIDIKSMNNELAHRIINDDFRKLHGKKIYLPYRSTIQHYTYSTLNDTIFSLPLFTEKITLSKLSTKKIAKNQFDLRKKFSDSGTLISDRVIRDTEEGLVYTMPANPADLDRVIEAALTGKDFIPTPLPSTTAIVIKWLLCIAGIAMIVYAGYEKFIKKKKKQ
jgi:hypothetical protein